MELPRFVPPMLATRGAPFDSDEYLFEIKWDGVRALASCEGREAQLVSRNEQPLSPKFPELFDPLTSLPSSSLLDGELILLRDGRADFPGILERVQRKTPLRGTVRPVTYVVFDLLFHEGERITSRPFKERRRLLREVIDHIDSPRLVLSDGVEGAGIAAFEHALEAGHEGVVAKRLDSPYLTGKRSTHWVKVKRSGTLVAAIIGLLLDESGDIRSLAVAADIDGELRWVGNVGSGLDETSRRKIREALSGRIRPAPLVPCAVEAQWVEPDLMCTVGYHEMTVSGMLRAPVFKGLAPT